MRTTDTGNDTLTGHGVEDDLTDYERTALAGVFSVTLGLVLIWVVVTLVVNA